MNCADHCQSSRKANMLAPTVLALVAAARTTEITDVSLDVDWGDFLGRHNMVWDWTWGSGGSLLLQPLAADLSHCGAGGAAAPCCIVGLENGTVQLAECSAQNASHQWAICKSTDKFSISLDMEPSSLVRFSLRILSVNGLSRARTSPSPGFYRVGFALQCSIIRSSHEQRHRSVPCAEIEYRAPQHPSRRFHGPRQRDATLWVYSDCSGSPTKLF